MLPTDFLREVTQSFPADFLTQEPQELEAYGKDWTRVHPPKPSAVVFPKSTDEVSRFLKLCSRKSVKVVPSGGRTGLAGGATAAQGEVVLSLIKMNRIAPVDALSQTVRVQAGAVTEAVHQHCAPHGLTWPIDFAAKGSSQVGGNIATNAGGLKVIRYGLTRNWVLGLQVVTMAGDILDLNGALEKNNTGVDLRQLFVGSEGTLGVITEATLKLTRLPGDLDVFFFAVEDISSVLKLFQEARRAPFQIMAFEFLTRNCMELVMEKRNLKAPFPDPHGAYVLLELERSGSRIDQPSTQLSHPSDARKESLDSWLEGLFEKGFVQDGVLAQSPREFKELWSFREGISESLAQQGFVHKNDIALPISSLESFISEMLLMFSQRTPPLEVYLFGHIGDGNLHVNTLMPIGMEIEVFKDHCQHADEKLFTLVQKYRGSVSAEHGIGLLKKKALKFSRTPAELQIMKGLKHLLDPQGLLNPGKIMDS